MEKPRHNYKVIQNTKVQDAFNQSDVQLNETAKQMIDEEFSKIVQGIIKRCKDGNVKRLTPNLYHLVRPTQYPLDH